MSIIDMAYQERATGFFQQALATDRLSHAYLLAGPRGVGKATAAKEFAKLLLCERPVPIEREGWRDSCGQCASCRLVQAGNHPDLHMVYKELIATISGKENHKATELGIDVIRQEVIEKVGLTPGIGRVKVFIILEAERMSRSAQNALLKTLEEPPKNTYLFLVTERINAMLPTIRSRASSLIFGLLPEEFILKKLSEAGAKEAETRFLARFAPGKLGLIMELYRSGVYDLKERLGKDLASLEPASADDFAQWILEESKTLSGRMVEADGQARVSETESARTALKVIFALIGGFYRDSLRSRLGFAEETWMNAEQSRIVDQLSADLSVDAMQRKIAHLARAEKLIEANVNVTLVVTDLVHKIAGE